MSRLDDLDRRSRAALGAALAFVGVLLLVVGWYLISGEAIAGKQLPYLASASLPGAVLVVCGFVLAVSGTTDPDTARKIAELHALLTEAVDEDPAATDPDPAATEPTEPEPMEPEPTGSEE
ncbi:hypothetical protein KGQ20_08690 [Catenulispora sp. NF23]|uniref:Uncharacterized protein n=1 Tax=Catenulispora pinistramenti TaxID=2705254 RepID=A0ABS5KJN5_9ACTN|nr:hypothetical protein [Catenulispora pinistramenti]MBS2532849.1 hypothetical protein [Catenulispora pinistramenti]MBS2546337.1 hypothetical protein [Catenulispora pinistramenti]